MVNNIKRDIVSCKTPSILDMTEKWVKGRSFHIDGCLIMQCTSGFAELTINSRSYIIQSGNIAVLTFDMVAVPVSKSEDFVIRTVSVDFNHSQEVFFSVTSNRLWDYLYATPIFNPHIKSWMLYTRWFDFITELLSYTNYNEWSSIVRNELDNFFIIVSNTLETISNSTRSEPAKNRAWNLSIEFFGLLNRYYSSHHDVAFYAEQLNITPNYLNIIARRYCGTTAKEQINLLITLVVRNLLENTSLTIKEISQRLNYDDPSYLCRIFRKRTGMSPLEYRNKTKVDSGMK